MLQLREMYLKFVIFCSFGHINSIIFTVDDSRVNILQFKRWSNFSFYKWRILERNEWCFVKINHIKWSKLSFEIFLDSLIQNEISIVNLSLHFIELFTNFYFEMKYRSQFLFQNHQLRKCHCVDLIIFKQLRQDTFDGRFIF